MKEFGIFNLAGWLVVILMVGSWLGSGDDLSAQCFGVLGGGALIVIDVIWLIALGIARLDKAAKEAALAVPNRVVETAEVSLVAYLKEARARGVEASEIEARLLRNGWSTSEIRRARELLSS